jgi:demethylmenaquinone methyltransferase / 2-methoxy-6-polyprenyl-1,4-benzoquinol methylase
MKKYNEEFIEKLFDRVSLNYDFLNIVISLGFCIFWNKKTMKLVDEYTLEKGSFVDIGCGTGLFCTKLNKKRNDIKITGIDNSLEMVKKAKKRNNEIQFLKGSVVKLPFQTNKFDSLLTSYTLRNFPELEKSITEMIRIVDINGYLIMVDLFKPYNKILQKIHYFFTNIIMVFLVKIFTQDQDYKYLSESIQKQIDEDKLIYIFKKNNCNLISKYHMLFGCARFFVFQKN